MQPILFTIEKPAIARLSFPSELRTIIEKALSFKDKSVQYQYEKLKKNKWAAQKDPIRYLADLEKLKSQINKSLLFHDDDGFFTYSGVFNHLKEYLRLYNHEIKYSNQVNYPGYELLPYELNYKPTQLRYYQSEAVDALLEHKHASISHPTGAGKSIIIEKLTKTLGLKTLIVAPTVSIASRLYSDLLKAFGKKYVGMVGNKKREFSKKITVAIGASLIRLDDSEEIKELQKNQVFVVDESHMWAADTLAKIAIELCGEISYRFFLSATQQRGDGRDLLLESVIGPVVHKKTYRELVNEGFLADLHVNMILMKSTSDYSNPNNPVRMSQAHYIYNKEVLNYASQLINEYQDKGDPTVVLCDEHEQLKLVSNKLKYTYEVASSDTDVVDVVNKFNAGECKLLLGTSAVGMGTDIKPVKRLFILQYGSSETQFKQALGRATRLVDGKTSCQIYVFHVVEGFSAGVTHFKNQLKILDDMEIKPHLHDFRGN